MSLVYMNFIVKIFSCFHKGYNFKSVIEEHEETTYLLSLVSHMNNIIQDLSYCVQYFYPVSLFLKQRLKQNCIALIHKTEKHRTTYENLTLSPSVIRYYTKS